MKFHSVDAFCGLVVLAGAAGAVSLTAALADASDRPDLHEVAGGADRPHVERSILLTPRHRIVRDGHYGVIVRPRASFRFTPSIDMRPGAFLLEDLERELEGLQDAEAERVRQAERAMIQARERMEEARTRELQEAEQAIQEARERLEETRSRAFEKAERAMAKEMERARKNLDRAREEMEAARGPMAEAREAMEQTRRELREAEEDIERHRKRKRKKRRRP